MQTTPKCFIRLSQQSPFNDNSHKQQTAVADYATANYVRGLANNYPSACTNRQRININCVLFEMLLTEYLAWESWM